MDIQKTLIDFLNSGGSWHSGYDCMWLEAMLEKAEVCQEPGSTLILGSSYAISSVYEKAWKNAINCSLVGQDLYYDYMCAKRILHKSGIFDKCFIFLGYYDLYYDESLSKKTGYPSINKIYHHIFGNSHHCNVSRDTLWEGFDHIPSELRPDIENCVKDACKEHNHYFGLFMGRGTSTLQDYPIQTRKQLGIEQAVAHNKQIRNIETLKENREILSCLVRLLKQYDIMPIIVIPPFPSYYLANLTPQFEQSLLNCIDEIPEALYYTDFNKYPHIFEDNDFIDIYHLAEKGERKLSEVLTMIYGL